MTLAKLIQEMDEAGAHFAIITPTGNIKIHYADRIHSFELTKPQLAPVAVAEVPTLLPTLDPS